MKMNETEHALSRQFLKLDGWVHGNLHCSLDSGVWIKFFQMKLKIF